MAVESSFYEQTDLWGSENDLDTERTAIRASELAKLLPAEFASLLDVGTGDGRVLKPLSAALTRAPLVVGLDRSGAALAHLALNGVQASADSLPFADRSVDVITACEILEHLPGPIYSQARSELARVARKSVVITVPNDENRRRAEVACEACGCRYNRRRHLRSFRLETFDDLLPGFKVAASAEFGHHTRIYPRLARQTLERRGLLAVHDAPECPQCGQAHGRRATDSAEAGSDTAGRSVDGGPGRYWRVRAMIPAERRPYWLGVRLDRS